MPGMDMGQGCCDEKTETMVLDDDFQLSQWEIDITPEYELLVAYLVTELGIITEHSSFESINPLNTGPPVHDEPLYLTVQSFLL
jgi:hypothetical protein